MNGIDEAAIELLLYGNGGWYLGGYQCGERKIGNARIYRRTNENGYCLNLY